MDSDTSCHPHHLVVRIVKICGVTQKWDVHVNDNDNDHSFSELSVHKALTCPEGLSAWAVAPPWLAKEIRSMQKDELNKAFRSDLLPLGIKWFCICAKKEMCYTQYECIMRNPGCCCLGRVYLVWLLQCGGNSNVC